VAVVQAGLKLLESGFPLSDLLALAREHNAATHNVAEQAVALFDRHVRVPLRASDLSDDEKARQLVDAFRTLLPAVTALVEHHFRRVLLEVAQEHLSRREAPARRAGAEAAFTERAAAAGGRRSATVEQLRARRRLAVEEMFDRIAAPRPPIAC
jgi:hypothetical protein